MRRTLGLLIVSLLIVGSCAPRSGGRGGSVAIPKETLPVLDEELEAELRDVSTDFTMLVPDDRYAWERAQLFFKEHTSQSKFSAGKGDAITLSNASGNDAVIYNLQKTTPPDGGSRFVLSCRAGSRPVPADTLSVQCKNLARFIHFGILEQSLLLR